MKSYITGIGGVFFKAKDKQQTMDWFKTHFGLESESWGKVFSWRDYEDPKQAGSLTWSPFPWDTDYFLNPNQQFMVNYRVTNLDELLEKLKSEGIIEARPSESYDYGKFAWVYDPDGNLMELWEPVDSAFGL